MSKTKTTICLILLTAVIISVISPVFLNFNLNITYAETTTPPKKVRMKYLGGFYPAQETIITRDDGSQERIIKAETSETLDDGSENFSILTKTDTRKDTNSNWTDNPIKDDYIVKDPNTGKEIRSGTTSGSSQKVNDPCFWGLLPTPTGECFLYAFSNLSYIIFRVTNYFTYAGGYVFNAAIGFSITKEAFDNEMVNVGWKTTRDFANMFFIFIILYIAIATILQLSGYGSKSLLVKVVIVALLINFSLMITRVVIDASHVLAWEFYNKVGNLGRDNDQAANVSNKNEKELIEIPGDVVVNGVRARDLAAVFMAGSNVQRVTSPDGYKELMDNKLMEGESVAQTWWQILVILLLASVLNIVAGFVLFAGGVLFVIRIVVLWFVMILAPLAFVGMILPGKMAGFAKTWWDKLFSQAFFAPAFLFLFYLVAKLINTNFLTGMVGAANDSLSSRIIGLDPSSTIIIVFHFLVIILLTIGCLIIAQQMGAHGSGMVISWGKKLQGVAQGYVGYYSKRGAGLAAEGLLRAQKEKEEDKEEGWVKTVGRGAARVLGRVPMANRGFGRASSWREKQMKEETKKAGKEFGAYSEAGLGALQRTSGRNIIFSQTKEGFKQAVLKKDEKEREQEKYRDALAQLASDTDTNQIIKPGEIKEMLKKGQRKKMDEGIEKTTSIKITRYEKEIDTFNKEVDKLDTSIKHAESMLDDMLRTGKVDTDTMDRQKNSINAEKAQRAIQKQKIKENEKKLKDIEKLENQRDKMERSKEFKDLESSIGGISGAKGGGGTIL